MSTSNFYERYWRREGGSPADHHFALAERQAKLRNALARLPNGSQVLDAGCGNGEFSTFLAHLGHKVTAVDISVEAISKAKATFPDGHFEVASLEEGLPFADGEFAAVWCTEVLEHLFEVHAALAHLNRVMRQGGLLVLTTPYHGRIKNLAIALAGFERHYNPYISHIRFYTNKSLDMCLTNGGFTALTWSGIGRRWPLWMSHFVVARKTSAPGPAPEIIG
jgi:2-polyprenyl-6-hydroxyphenyl methylase/3-demethylubiquinone-9 3-methyltransferase